MPDEPQPLKLTQVFASVAWSFFGVQSSRNRERDFTRGRPWQFIVLGFGMTALVVLGFNVAVRIVLHGVAGT
jgi:hypothetical protein